MHLDFQFDYERGWVAWVSIWKTKDEYDRNEETVLILLCCFAIPGWDIVHLDFRFDCDRDKVLWVSKQNGNDKYNRNEEIVLVSLCCSAMPDQDIVHHDLQLDSGRWRVVRVPTWNEEDIWQKGRNWFSLTLLFCIAWLRYWAPWSSIWLRSRLSCLSVYMK